MLRDRSAPVDLFALVPALELRFEPELAELDRLLEDDQIFQQVKADLSRRRPHTTETGRPSTPVEVILRLLVRRTDRADALDVHGARRGVARVAPDRHRIGLDEP